MNLRTALFSLIFLLSACTNFQRKEGVSSTAQIPHEIPSYHVTDPAPPQVTDVELEQIPVEINERVEMWLRYFQGKGRPHMERYLSRSTRYIGLMKNILRQNGLPEDLIYIALIESGFSSRATSRAAAVGYWQFIRGTGKRYGLEINRLIDERRDPVLSTQAAAEYYKGLYSMFGSWYLSMAAYNVGENRVKKAITKYMTRDFWELAKRKKLPKETINYVPKFIAAKLIGKDPAKYGFTGIDYEKPIEFELIKVDKPLNMKTMAANMGLEYEDLKLLNPKFKGEIAPTKESGALELRVPVGQRQAGLNAATQSFVDKVELIADLGETETYKIRAGDSLYTIARKYRTTVAWLRDTNDIKPGKKLRIGMRIQVPDRAAPSKKVVQAQVSKPKVKPILVKEDSEAAQVNPEIVNEKGVFYIVQNGDTLSEIAEQYDSTISELRKMNRLGKGSMIRAGMKLRVPKDEGLPQDVEGLVEKKSMITHKVQAGENLNVIAQKYGVTVQDLKKVNNLKKRSMIRAGSELRLPPSAKRPEQVDSGSRLPSSSRRLVRNKAKVHIVKRGENLSLIANKYDVSIQQLKIKNKIGKKEKILIGMRLEI